jgi:hypothetical protein
MSGVIEVRLYRNTVDEVPAEYTNVTAAVLNSSTKNHATGVKRYLDGVTTVSGLDPGINYFWVELIDARGNTAGPQPAGSYMPTVWEFFVAVPSAHPDLFLYTVSSSFGGEAVFADTWRPYGDRSYSDESDASIANAVGSLLWTIADVTDSVSPVFYVDWHRSKHTPGVEIRRNGVTVYKDTNNQGPISYPARYTITYAI